MDANTVRAKMLEVVEELSKQGPGMFQQSSVLDKVAQELSVSKVDDQQVILTVFGDLFRTGHLSWGHNLSNPNPPFLHLTDIGRRALAQFSRDPANPDGYLAHLKSMASITPLVESYVEEALTTYTSACYKAAAVMIGCASECLVLDLRDALVSKMKSLNKNVPNKLEAWQVLTVLNAIQPRISQQNLPRELREEFDSLWSGFTGQLRTIRNAAGHPKSLQTVTEELAHSALLLFPAMAKLAQDLMNWVASSYQ